MKALRLFWIFYVDVFYIIISDQNQKYFFYLVNKNTNFTMQWWHCLNSTLTKWKFINFIV